jgi:hypothetical protein
VSGTGPSLDAILTLEGVPSALAAARDGVDALLRDRRHRRTTPDVTAESLLRGAAASATLEGSSTGLDALRGGAADLVAMRAARLNAGLLAMVPVVGRAPLQVLARLHTLAAAGATPPEALGRPRPDDLAADRLRELSAMLLAPTAAPAVAVAAVTHAEIVTLAPFTSGNGLVARAMERLLLVARGVDPTSVVVPEAGHLAAGASYLRALAAYAERTPGGSRAWLLYAAEALGAATEASPLNDSR